MALSICRGEGGIRTLWRDSWGGATNLNVLYSIGYPFFFASFNFVLDLIAENTGLTAGTNLISRPGHQFQVDPRAESLNQVDSTRQI